MNAPPPGSISVGQVCRRTMLECALTDSIATAATLMHRMKSDSILVKNGAQVVGIWTQKDALGLNLAEANVLDTPVAQAMSAPVNTIPANAGIGEAALDFHRLGVRHLLVLDPTAAPYGIVSYADVINQQGLDYFVPMRAVGTALRGAPLVVKVDDAVSSVLARMAQFGHDAAVVERDGEMGIFTATDLIGLIQNRQTDLAVGEIASFPLLTVAWESSLYHAHFLLMERTIQHLGVEKDGRFAGLLSYSDILECVTSGYLRDLQQTLRSQAEELLLSHHSLQVQDSSGGVSNSVTVLADIPEQKRVTEELQRTRHEMETRDTFLQVVLDSLPISIQVKDPQGRNLLLNESAAQLFGFSIQELAGRSYFDVLPESSARGLQDIDDLARAQGSLVVREASIEQQGGVSHLLVHARSVKVGAQEVLVSAAVDITSRRMAELRLAQDNRILSMLAQGQTESVILTAICRDLETLLPGALASVLILSEDGLTLRHGAAPSLPCAYSESINGVRIGAEVGSCGSAAWHREPAISPDLRKDPRWKDFLALAESHHLRACWSMPVLGPDDTVLGTLAAYFSHPRQPRQTELDVLSQSADVAAIAIERGRVLSRLHRLATTDALTGLPNRQHFLDLSSHQLRVSHRLQEAAALCMIDADHFKRINDELGHAAGDTVLAQLAGRLQAALREGDVCGRIGGEEFAVLLPGAERLSALEIAERLRLAVAERPFELASGRARQGSISIGLALREPEESLQALMARADQALYAAKQSGRNRVSTAD